MKKTVLTFGLISGAIMAVMMFAWLPFIDRIGFDKGVVLGYTTMVLAFMLVFFGIRSYRENVNGGYISFGRGFAVGIIIAAISCACYVAAWEILYFNFMPDFLDKYGAHLIEKLKASGATQQAIDTQMQEIKDFKATYANPLVNVALTFLEPFWLGFLIALVSAAILRKRKKINSTGGEHDAAAAEAR